MQRHNAEDEPKTQHKHDHRVNLQTGRFVGVEAWLRGGEGLASGIKRGALCHYVIVRSWKLGSPFPLLSSKLFQSPVESSKSSIQPSPQQFRNRSRKTSPPPQPLLEITRNSNTYATSYYCSPRRPPLSSTSAAHLQLYLRGRRLLFVE